MKSLLLIITFLLIPSNSVLAAEFNNADALQGITEAKAIFDINQGNPEILLLRLQLVEKTFEQLKAAGTTAKFVLSFRGKASNLLTVGDQYILEEDQAIKHEIKTLLEKFSQLGLPLEQCAIAAGLAKINTDDILPQIKVVANGYTSLIAYQNRGYAFIPME